MELGGPDETEDEGLRKPDGIEELGGPDKIKDKQQYISAFSRPFSKSHRDRQKPGEPPSSASRGEKAQIDSSNSRSGPLLIPCYLLIQKVHTRC